MRAPTKQFFDRNPAYLALDGTQCRLHHVRHAHIQCVMPSPDMRHTKQQQHKLMTSVGHRIECASSCWPGQRQRSASPDVRRLKHRTVRLHHCNTLAQYRSYLAMSLAAMCLHHVASHADHIAAS
jgi:hypothetical protein